MSPRPPPPSEFWEPWLARPSCCCCAASCAWRFAASMAARRAARFGGGGAPGSPASDGDRCRCASGWWLGNSGGGFSALFFARSAARSFSRSFSSFSFRFRSFLFLMISALSTA